MGSDTPKVLLGVAGRTVLEWSVSAFADAPGVDSIIVVAHPDSIPRVAEMLNDVAKVEAIVPGGLTRSASTRAALDAIPAQDGIVLIHDGARPAVRPETVADLVATMARADAATVAVPAADTILHVEGGTVVAIPDRTALWHAQTPQGFRLPILRRAHAAAEHNGTEFTDDCGVVLEYQPHIDISVVPGSADNVKVTTPEDLARAEQILTAKIGADGSG